MKRDEVIKAFCELSSRVGEQVFQHSRAHDCFCNGPDVYFQFDDEVFQFIVDAVEEKIKRKQYLESLRKGFEKVRDQQRGR